MVEYKSFYKTVSGNEGMKCKHPTRLDSYGRGCAHDCRYCYARSLLDFRGLWRPEDPAVADIWKIRRKLDKVPAGTILRLGGMTDCFQPAERKRRITYMVIKELNKRRLGYLIVTKSGMVADDEYIELYDPDLVHIQVTITPSHQRMMGKQWSMRRRAGLLTVSRRLKSCRHAGWMFLSAFLRSYRNMLTSIY